MSRRAAGGPSKGASNDEEESVEDKKVMNALIDQMRDLLPVSAAVKSNMASFAHVSVSLSLNWLQV